MKLQSILITLILIMFSISYAAADYSVVDYSEIRLSDKVWYVSEALVWFVMALCFVKGRLGFIWKVLAGFFLIRLVCEILWAIFGMNIIYTGTVTRIMYWVTFLIICFITLYNSLKKWLNYLLR